MSLKSSFTITFLSGTDSLYVETQVVKFEDDNSSVESAGSLLQVYASDTKSVTPDWTTSTNQPCIKLGLTKSSDGSNIGLTTDCAFKYQGNDITFGTSATTLNTMSWYTSTDGNFMMAYNDTSDGSDAYVYLRICANIASADITTNQQIDYTLAYDDATFGSGSVTGTTDILIREGSSSSLYCNIITDNTELSSTTTSTVLSVQYIYGGAEYSNLSDINDSYSLAWYRDGDTDSLISTDDTVTIYREENDDSGAYPNNYVDGCNVFTVAVLDASGNTIASDSQRITDVADEYHVELTQSGTVRSNKSATIKGILYQGDDSYDGAVTYTTSVRNSNNEETGSAETTSSSTTGFSRTISASQCAYENADGETEYGDAILIVQCEIE